MSLTITCRRPSDLAAAAIGVLGFVPKNSAVMLTFGGKASFHTRMDLDPSHQRVCDALLDPVLRHGVPAVALIAFIDEEAAAETTTGLLDRLVDDFTTHNIQIAAAPLLVVEETIHHRDGTTEPCDWRSHAGVAALVAQGRRIESSRDALNERVQQIGNALTQGPRTLQPCWRTSWTGTRATTT